MLFIQVFCVFTFLVFCLDFYLYNRESLKTKIITVEFFGFYSIFFVCSFFPCLGQHTPSACLFSFFSVRVFGVDGCVCVCVLQHYQTFVLVLMQFCSEGVSYSFFSRREFSCVFVWVCFCLWVFFLLWVQTNWENRKTLARSSNRSTDCDKKEKQTDTGTPQTVKPFSRRSYIGKEWIKESVLEKKEKKISPTLLFLLLMQLLFCGFHPILFPNRTSEIDLPRISLVCLCFFLFSFVSVILFILICLHSSYNIYKTSQKYKRIFCWENYTII